jgi:hypothetical protein
LRRAARLRGGGWPRVARRSDWDAAACDRGLEPRRHEPVSLRSGETSRVRPSDLPRPGRRPATSRRRRCRLPPCRSTVADAARSDISRDAGGRFSLRNVGGLVDALGRGLVGANGTVRAFGSEGAYLRGSRSPTLGAAALSGDPSAVRRATPGIVSSRASASASAAMSAAMWRSQRIRLQKGELPFGSTSPVPGASANPALS